MLSRIPAIRRRVLLAVSLAGVATVAWASSDHALRDLAKAKGLTGDPLEGRTFDSIETPKAQLGKMLFFSRNLSGRRDTACASCHHPRLGGGDALALSIGHNAEEPDLLGPGRVVKTSRLNKEGVVRVPRNASTTFNIGLYKDVLFFDGRVEHVDGGINTPRSQVGKPDPTALENLVQTQALFPVASVHEMAGDAYEPVDGLDGIYGDIEKRFRYLVNADNETKNVQDKPSKWVKFFRSAFNEPDQPIDELVNYTRIAQALASYQESQIFIDSPWQRYLSGKSDELKTDAKRGAELFFKSVKEGGANCIACHTGDRFTDEKFHVIAMPQIGRGKNVHTKRSKTDDLGRYMSSLKQVDMHAFRTPTLLNVADTGPWGHAGAYDDLADVIRHHADPVNAVKAYTYDGPENQIEIADLSKNALNAVDSFNRAWPDGTYPMHGVDLSDADVAALVAFLEALTDPCVRDAKCLAPWLPSEQELKMDDAPLHAVDVRGDDL